MNDSSDNGWNDSLVEYGLRLFGQVCTLRILLHSERQIWKPDRKETAFGKYLLLAAKNAQILYNYNKDENEKKAFLDLLLELMQSLAFSSEENLGSEGRNDVDLDSEASAESYEDLHSDNPSMAHTPAELSCSNPDSRQCCRICGEKSRIRCLNCSVFLHCKESSTGSCWVQYHEHVQ